MFTRPIEFGQHSTDLQRLNKIVFVVDLRNQNFTWRFKTNKLAIVDLDSKFDWTICKCNMYITEFHLDQLHRKSRSIFNKKKTFRQTQPTNFIQCISTNNRPDAYLKFQPKGVTVVLIGRRALCQDIFIIQKLLICTDSAVVQAL